MKKLLYFIIIAVTIFSCTTQTKEEKTETQPDVYFFTSFREPAVDGLYLLYSKDGYHWADFNHVFQKPEVGASKIMRDPSMVKGPDGTFHMVWTTGWRGERNFGYASTKDLIHWTQQRTIPVMEHDTSVVNVWAPELFYDDEKQEYIILWASTIPYKFEKGIEEEKNNHRMYYTTTKDFKTFPPAKLYLDPGFSVIDAVIVKRAKEDYVLVLKDNTRPERNLKISFGKSPLGPWSTPSEPFTGKLTEGPTVIKPANDYLIYYDSYGDKQYKAAKTRDFIHFSDATPEISIPEGHKHGTIFKASPKILEQLLEYTKTIPKDTTTHE